MALPKTIALDGPAAAGKTSVASAVAQALGYLFVDTGAFYRAVTLAAIRAGVPSTAHAALVEVARRVRLDIGAASAGSTGQYTVLLDGEDVTQAIRAPEVEADVSAVSAVPGVRDVLNQRYRELAAAHERVIMAGRDIGTVVLPDADLKIYLDASPEVRADRRYAQAVAEGRAASRQVTQKALVGRDQYDSQRAVAPLRAAPDALRINTDALDIAAVIARVLAAIHDWEPRSGG